MVLIIRTVLCTINGVAVLTGYIYTVRICIVFIVICRGQKNKWR